jgi:regulator of RNase E activity RraA
MSDKNLKRAHALDTATISDALDRLGIAGQCFGLAPRDPSFSLCGRAFTVQYGPPSKPVGTVGDFIDDVAPGQVVAIDNDGRTDCTVWGDILTEVAHAKRVAGVVINGVNRDVHLCRTLGFPIFSLGGWMRTGKDRVQVESVNTVINVGHARVAPGDILRGDADGVLVIPQAHEDAVLDAAEKIAAAEDSIRALCRAGETLSEARAKIKYHSLQTRSE